MSRFLVITRYQGYRCSVAGRNLPSSSVHPAVIDAELASEVSAGHLAGPFSPSAIPNVHCSGLGVVPKKGRRFCMIMLPMAIPLEDFSLRYPSIDDAVSLLHQAGRGALMAKVDLKSVFRMIPVRSQNWCLLGMQWNDCLYINKCLPFGLRSALFLFNQFADALSWIMRANYGVTSHIHYLLVGPADSDQCHHHMLSLCTCLEIPVTTNKLQGPTTCLTFLGIQIDSIKQELSLLPSLWLARKKCTGQ